MNKRSVINERLRKITKTVLILLNPGFAKEKRRIIKKGKEKIRTEFCRTGLIKTEYTKPIRKGARKSIVANK